MIEEFSFSLDQSAEHPREPEFSETRLTAILDEIEGVLRECAPLVRFGQEIERKEFTNNILKSLGADSNPELSNALYYLLISSWYVQGSSPEITKFKKACLSLDQNSSELYYHLLRTEEMLKDYLEKLKIEDERKNNRRKRANNLLEE